MYFARCRRSTGEFPHVVRFALVCSPNLGGVGGEGGYLLDGHALVFCCGVVGFHTAWWVGWAASFSLKAREEVRFDEPNEGL